MRPALVNRSRILGRLHEGSWRPLTIITAPAGYGKTTLTCQWIGIQSRKAAWLSLDKDDNDPARFLKGMVAAIERIALGFSEGVASQSDRQELGRLSMEVIVNEISRSLQEFFLVLDDFHFIRSQSVLDALQFLLDHLPQQLFLIVTGRSRLPLTLARVRAQDAVNEITLEDLKFDSAEVRAFLNDVMKLMLSRDAARELEMKTEGWIAGLQLSALSMKGGREVSSVLGHLPGNLQYVTEYLTEEVLNRQPEPIQTFLLKCSILERWCAPLCAAVAGEEKAHEMIDEIDSSNLFVLSLDSEGEWFRLHHLFRELLQRHLQKIQPGLIPELHLKASQWYSESDLTMEAINHLLEAHEYVQAAKLIEDFAETLFLRREIRVLENWLDKLPKRIIQSRPFLILIQAGVWLTIGEIKNMKRCVREAELALQTEPPSDHSTATEIRGELAMFHGYIAELDGDLDEAIQHFQDSLSLLPNKESYLYKTVRWKLDCFRALNVEGTKALSASVSPTTILGEGDDYERKLAMLAQAQTRLCQGQFKAAAKSFQILLKSLNNGTTAQKTFRAIILGQLACINYQWNNLQAAEEFAKECIEISDRTRDWTASLAANLTLVSLALVSRDFDRAHELLNSVVWATADVPLLQRTLKAHQAEVWISGNEMVRAEEWWRECGLAEDSKITVHRDREFLAASRFLLASEERERSLAFLQRLEVASRSGGRHATLIEALLIKAQVLCGLGQAEMAVADVKEAVELAAPENLFRLFIDEGQVVHDLLEELQVDVASRTFVDKLLKIFSNSDYTVETTELQSLSRREMEVLRLVSAGFSNREIGESLFISTGTVKRHVHNILGKLNVANRAQAGAMTNGLKTV